MNSKDFEIPKNTNAGIYMLYNGTKHLAYIGQTTNFYQRAVQHKTLLRSRKHTNKMMQLDFSDGDTFYFVILEELRGECENDHLLMREKLYMYAFMHKGLKLYNCESLEQIKENLFMTFFLPSIWEIYPSLHDKLGCWIGTLSTCGDRLLEEKFRKANESFM